MPVGTGILSGEHREMFRVTGAAGVWTVFIVDDQLHEYTSINRQRPLTGCGGCLPKPWRREGYYGRDGAR